MLFRVHTIVKVNRFIFGGGGGLLRTSLTLHKLEVYENDTILKKLFESG